MDQEPLRRLVCSLRQSTEPAGGTPDNDAQLLDRFLTHADGNAFELLLWRHGPMVLGVCRRLLASPHDAEDAFQATFLTLVRKAATISAGAALGAWLYRVAYRVALRLRAGLARRAKRERNGVEELPAPAAGEPPADDLRAVLDEEVNRLPARHRAAFILCCLEGKTGAEAARQLGCPPGTVSSRLTRARAQLRRRLARRGLAPSAVALAAALTGEGWAAAVPALLVRSTLEAARLFATGAAAGGALSQQAITIAEGVMRTMSLTRIKIVTCLLLVFGLLAAGAVLTRPALDAAPVAEPRPDPPPAKTEKKPGEAGKRGPVAVQVVRPQPGGLTRTTTQRCTLQSFDQAHLVPRVAGALKELTVDIGDRVKQGQVLAEIEAPLLALDEQQAAATFNHAKSQVREAQARINAAKAELVGAKGLVEQKAAELKSDQALLAYQKASYERMKRLAEVKSVDATVVEEKAHQFQAAAGKVAAATVAVENARAEVAHQEAKVVQAEAALETARANVQLASVGVMRAQVLHDFTRIRAPFDGVVTARHYHVGDYLRAGDQGGSAPLFAVERTGRMRAIVQIAENEAVFVERGLPVELTVDAFPNRRISAKVSRVAFGLDAKTATMRAEIDIPNEQGQLRPGLTGAAKIQLEKRANALRLPVSTLVRPYFDNEKNAVYVVRDGKAHRTPVRIGPRGEDEVEILSGVGPKDLVVVRPRGEWPDVVPVKVEERKRPR